MKTIAILLSLVLIGIFSTPAFADQYDDAKAKCPTYECQMAITSQQIQQGGGQNWDYDPRDKDNQRANQITQNLQIGFKQLDEGYNDQAIGKFNKVLERTQNEDQFYDAHFGLGLAHGNLEKWDKAVFHMDVGLHGEYLKKWDYTLAEFLYLSGDYQRAHDIMQFFNDDETENLHDIPKFKKQIEKELKKEQSASPIVDKPTQTPPNKVICGEGTVDIDGICQVDTTKIETKKDHRGPFDWIFDIFNWSILMVYDTQYHEEVKN